MRDDVRSERIKASLEAARLARQRGDGDARLAALEAALADAVVLAEPAVVSAVCWRLAKARYDQGVHHGLLDAVAPLLDTAWKERNLWGVREVVGPFDHYPQGLAALEPLTRRVWDHEGYRHPALPILWQAWIQAHETRGDAFSVAWGHTTFAWQQAATGQVDAVAAVTLRHARMPPGALAEAPSHHGRAADPSQSVPWLQLDLARTLLRAATWAGDERRAWEAAELMEDAAEDAGLVRRADFWFLDAQLRAALRFGWAPTLTGYTGAYAALADHPSLPSPHRQRASAWLIHRRGAPAGVAYAQAAQALHDAHAGPEWVVEAWLDAAEQPDAPAGSQASAQQEATRTGVVMDRLRPRPV